MTREAPRAGPPRFKAAQAATRMIRLSMRLGFLAPASVPGCFVLQPRASRTLDRGRPLAAANAAFGVDAARFREER